jgi:hypothetical protein
MNHSLCVMEYSLCTSQALEAACSFLMMFCDSLLFGFGSTIASGR